MYTYMGKRKRADLNKTPSPADQLPPPGMDSLSKQENMYQLNSQLILYPPQELMNLKFSHRVDCSPIKSLSSIMDIDDTSKLTQSQQSSIIHRRNIDQAICSKHPPHYYGLHYTRRRSANNAGASTSHGGTTPFYDGKMSLKPASKCNSDSGHDTDSRQSELQRPETVAHSLLAMNATSSNVTKLFCVLCQKPLKKKRYILDSSISSSEPSVVAVLVCGHLYHADCLEDRTHHEDATDPPCPICRGIN